jgi:hypothetical protein
MVGRNFGPDPVFSNVYIPQEAEAVVTSPGIVSEVSSPGFFPFPFSSKILLTLTLGSLLFALACGSDNSSNFPITGGFTDASLSGQFVYRLSGTEALLNNGNQAFDSFTEAGTFTADGAGHILSGMDDFNSSNGFAQTAFTGSYHMTKDGNGTMTLNIGGGTINLSFTMVSTSKFYFAQSDAFLNFSANAAGECVKQNTSAFAAPPNGTFVFRVHQTFPTTVSEGTVGALTSTNGNITGDLDVVRSNSFSSLTFSSGNFSAPDLNGRGDLTYTDSQALTTNFKYYVIDANTFWFMETDQNTLGVGTAEKQSSGSLTLAGNYAFGSSGDTNTNIGGVRTVGVFTAGSGTLSDGGYDSVQDGNSIVNQPFDGTYTETANGRVNATFTPTSGSPTPIQNVFWMVTPSRAYFLVNDVNKVEEGTIDLQQISTFNTSDLSGQYALVMDGNTQGTLLTRIGTFIPDGKGNLSLNEEANSLSSLPGTINDVVLSGTYSVSGNGRVTSAIDTISSNMVLYMVSSGQAYILQNDPGVEISGQVTIQTSP